MDAAVAAHRYSKMALEGGGTDTGLADLEIMGYLSARRAPYSFGNCNNDKKYDNVNNKKDVKDRRRVIVYLPGVLQYPVLTRINYLITETERGGG